MTTDSASFNAQVTTPASPGASGSSSEMRGPSELFPLKPVLMLLGTVVLLIAGYYLSLFAIHGFDPDFLQINKCVESGGRWNSKLRICEQLPGTYIPPEPVSLDY